MAKCGGGCSNGSCQCTLTGGNDGGANQTPSTTFAGGGGAANPYSVQLATTLDTTYVPTVTGLTLGSGGSVVTRIERVGKEVTYSVVITLGTGFVLPATPIVPLPPGLPFRNGVSAGRILGLGTLFDLSATSSYAALVSGAGSTQAALAVQVNAMGVSGQRTALGAAVPFTWAVGDTIEFVLKYTTA